MRRDYSKLKKQLDYKIFAIGFNKTATSTIHNFFRKNGLSSKHAAGYWPLSKFQCFSDNGDKHNFKEYFKNYPKSIFLLNTRNLDKWITSRAKHYRYSKWGKPGRLSPSVERYKEWILSRQKLYKDVLEFFQKDPSRLYIVDIDKSGWINFLANIFNLKYINLHSNKLSDNKIPSSFLTLVNNKFNGACQELHMKESEKKSTLIIESLCNNNEFEKYEQLLKLYKENSYLNY